jgi:hypothetical protein
MRDRMDDHLIQEPRIRRVIRRPHPPSAPAPSAPATPAGPAGPSPSAPPSRREEARVPSPRRADRDERGEERPER